MAGEGQIVKGGWSDLEQSMMTSSWSMLGQVGMNQVTMQFRAPCIRQDHGHEKISEHAHGPEAMKVAGEVNFLDLASGGEAFAAVRYDADRVAICLSLKAGGDMEIELTKDDARKFSAALGIALK